MIIGVGYFSPIERSLVGSNSSKKVAQTGGKGVVCGMVCKRKLRVMDHGYKNFVLQNPKNRQVRYSFK